MFSSLEALNGTLELSQPYKGPQMTMVTGGIPYGSHGMSPLAEVNRSWVINSPLSWMWADTESWISWISWYINMHKP